MREYPRAFTRSYLSCSCVRVCANCESMRLLILRRDLALLWFGGMGGRGLEVADQDRQKSPGISSYHRCQLSLSGSFPHASLHQPYFTHPHHETIFIMNLFIYSFIFLITFHCVFYATCLILEQRGGVVALKQWVKWEKTRSSLKRQDWSLTSYTSLFFQALSSLVFWCWNEIQSWIKEWLVMKGYVDRGFVWRGGGLEGLLC